ncbi:CD1871A family CXXC motif-containing protein [Desulfoplanes formicivorans]|uniref:Thioredoxin n=1 Tax=Desulfoplanes formicivorans TaxID=1592317 RepID=A0A194AIL3_9BACT|nr:CD1871A family CXXC motif-containing protein [Desulfoplanes formicivorans]GAU09163.1 hypothetical protein DPF_1883 [Desulfoplanes formicivorans]
MPNRSTLISYLVLFFFLVLFILGINLGEVDSVFEKGVAICLSCIGIG